MLSGHSVRTRFGARSGAGKFMSRRAKCTCVTIEGNLRETSAHTNAHKQNKKKLRLFHAFFTRISWTCSAKSPRPDFMKIARPDSIAGLHGKFVTCACIFISMAMAGSVCVYMCVCVQISG